jgi:hypothetical protein
MMVNTLIRPNRAKLTDVIEWINLESAIQSIRLTVAIEKGTGTVIVLVEVVLLVRLVVLFELVVVPFGIMQTPD